MKSGVSDILATLPQSPGVYQFLNSKGDIIYIGKSKNLKARVSSYFRDGKSLNFAKKNMVKQVDDIRYIVTNNETESLILENSLIKEHQPKYNILLKDDKNFLYIKITDEEYPKVIKTRIAPSQIQKRDGYYFGPYVNGFHVSQILKILKNVFGYGVGNHNFFQKKGAYNLDKYIFPGKSDASEKQQQELYLEQIERIKNFLKGNTRELANTLEQEMKIYAENLEFEKAQEKKHAIEALNSLSTLQIVRDGVRGEYIVMQVLEKYGNIYVGVIDIKAGKITGYEQFEIENNLGLSSSEILQNSVEQKWVENRERPGLTFILPTDEDISLPEEIRYEVPQIGTKFDLLKLSYTNLYEYAHKKHMNSISTKNFSKSTMQSLLKILGYEPVNSDIIFECNDISHLSGTHTVASRSVIENGKRNPKKYKKFRVKDLETGKIDDFSSMREIFSRRLAELEKLGNLPDLIVIDGGKGQLGAVMEILSGSDLSDEIKQQIQLVSLAKRDEELFLPGQSEPIILEKDSAELRLVQALRDEAHRFAISFNRDSRSNSQKKNILESIPGIGPKTRKKILNRFGSLQNLGQTPREEVENALGKSVTDNLELHGII